MQSRNTYTNGDGLDHLDPYMSCPEAVISLVHIEHPYLPKVIWEPCAGTGTVVHVLQAAGYELIASDIHAYDTSVNMMLIDYLNFTIPGVEGIVTNTPYTRAEQFARKAIAEVPYVALLLRTNFLESVKRRPFFAAHPPTRVLIASRRLPMMHRYGWTGKRAGSNTSHAWFIWDRRPYSGPQLIWYDWRDIVEASAAVDVHIFARAPAARGRMAIDAAGPGMCRVVTGRVTSK
jgi:hypothetical protein